MDKSCTIKIVGEMLEKLSQEDFTGKIELNFTNGNIASVTKVEKVKFN